MRKREKEEIEYLLFNPKVTSGMPLKLHIIKTLPSTSARKIEPSHAT